MNLASTDLERSRQGIAACAAKLIEGKRELDRSKRERDDWQIEKAAGELRAFSDQMDVALLHYFFVLGRQ